MNITFQVKLEQENYLNEFDLMSLTNKQTSILQSKQSFYGRLIISHEEEPTITIEDTLDAWIQNLCFASIPIMLSEQTFKILYFSRPGYILLKSKELIINISGDLIPTMEFPIKLFIPPLFHCGNRFLKWSRKIKKNDTSYQANLDYIEKYRQPAIDALRSSELLSF